MIVSQHANHVCCSLVAVRTCSVVRLGCALRIEPGFSLSPSTGERGAAKLRAGSVAMASVPAVAAAVPSVAVPRSRAPRNDEELAACVATLPRALAASLCLSTKVRGLSTTSVDSGTERRKLEWTAGPKDAVEDSPWPASDDAREILWHFHVEF